MLVRFLARVPFEGIGKTWVVQPDLFTPGTVDMMDEIKIRDQMNLIVAELSNAIATDFYAGLLQVESEFLDVCRDAFAICTAYPGRLDTAKITQVRDYDRGEQNILVTLQIGTRNWASRTEGYRIAPYVSPRVNAIRRSPGATSQVTRTPRAPAPEEDGPKAPPRRMRLKGGR